MQERQRHYVIKKGINHFNELTKVQSIVAIKIQLFFSQLVATIPDEASKFYSLNAVLRTFQNKGEAKFPII